MTDAGDRLRRELVLNLAAAVVGALGGLAAYLFRSAVGLAQNLLFHGVTSSVGLPLIDHDLGLLVLVVPVAGAAAGLLIVRALGSTSEGSGAISVIEAASFRGGSMPLKDALARSLAAVATLGAGGAAGREGPILQLGGAGGSAVGSLLGLQREDRRILIASGALGGIAATFNAPVAAVVFAIEVIFLEFRTESFVPMVVASVFGTVVGRALLGDDPTFAIGDARFALSSPVEMGLVVSLGLSAGLVGVLFLWSSELSTPWFEELPSWSRPLVGGGAMGVLGFLFPRLLGVGYDTMQTVLSGAMQPGVMGSLALTFAVLLVLKPLAVNVTLGGGGSGGVFSPTIYVGIMLGALFGLGADAAFPRVAAGYPVYAVLGMVAVFTAVSRAPLTGIVLAFEFTRSFEILLPAMLAAVIADVVAWGLHQEGLYGTRLREIGIRLPHDLSPNVLDMVLVEEVMSRDVDVLRTDATIRESLDRMMRTGHGGFPVLDADDRLVGVVTRTDLRERPENVSMDASVREIASDDVLVALPDETVHRVLDRMVAHDIGHVPVVDPDDPNRLLGWITRTDLIRAEAADEDLDVPGR